MVLDLKELERELDNALDKETPESLNQFLEEQRAKTTKSPDYCCECNCELEEDNIYGTCTGCYVNFEESRQS